MILTIEIDGESSQHQQPATAENDSQTPADQVLICPYITGLREKLYNLLNTIRANSELDDREFKNNRFYELYEIISKLLCQGHLACFAKHSPKSLFIAPIDPGDMWRIEIEEDIANYLDVKNQFLDPKNQFTTNAETTTTYCPSKNTNMTFRSACFEGPKLVISKPIADCGKIKNIIYGIRCKECPSGDASNVRYIGKTKRSAHTRHGEHQEKTQTTKLSMYKHAAIEPHKSDFHNTMEMIYFPMKCIEDDKNMKQSLKSWECFWQFFCRARESDGYSGWCTNLPSLMKSNTVTPQKETGQSKTKLGEEQSESRKS